MRIVSGLVLILIACGWFACETDARWLAPSQPLEAVQPWGWRRTEQGWEKAEFWTPRRQYPDTAAHRIHPGLLLVLQFTLSWGFLFLSTPKVADSAKNEADVYENSSASPLL